MHRPTVTALALLALTCGLAACSPPPAGPPPQEPTPTPVPAPAPVPVVGNPAAPGFDADGSDPRAVEIADQVMERLGGRNAWDGTRYLSWRFFGGRRHVWDKWTGRHRYDDGDLTVLTNVHERRGRAWRGDTEITDPDSLSEILQSAYARWVNDSYWLVMPYKLKDSGVTLTYEGQGMTEEGLPAHVLELTFHDVGLTPQNRYRVWVDIHESLVRQWAFYADAADAEPRFVLPWNGWRQVGRIWLADDFGRRRHTEVAVHDSLPDAVFTDPMAARLTP